MYTDWKEQLDKNGYILIENIIDTEIVNKTKEGILKDKLKVDMMEYANFMIKKVCETLNTEIDFLKIRVSNNNNSVDAGGFHRDVICLKEWYPVMTCLTYFDDTVMEVIEGSHKINKLNFFEANNILNNHVKQINIKAGNILLFYSTLLHRGIFTNNSPNRRVIQVFDCFEKHNDHTDKIASILGTEKTNNLIILLHKFNLSSSILNLFAYYNFISGTSKFEDEAFADKIGYCMLSSEGQVKRWDYVPFTGEEQPINLYVINPNKKHFGDNILTEHRNEWYYKYYLRQIIIYIIYSLLFIIFIISMIVLIIKKSQ